MRRGRWFTTFLLLLFINGLSFACGHTTGPSGTGATIAGTMVAASGTSVHTASAARAITNAAFTGVTVSIVGTVQTATVDANNAFTLPNVPTGDITLRFQGAGIDSSLVVSSVQVGQNIAIVVAVAGGVVQLAEDSRQNGPTTVTGAIGLINPNQSFTVNGITVDTTSTTIIMLGSAVLTFAQLTVGTHVTVSGTLNGNEVMATRIDVQDAATQPVTVSGSVQGFFGTSTEFQFTIGGTVVHGDATTTFIGSAGFAQLANGRLVQVTGQQQNGFIQATQIAIS